MSESMPNSVNKKDAMAAGLMLFFNGKPCKRGHVSPRYVSTSDCVECVAAKNNANLERAREVRAREERVRRENDPRILRRIEAISRGIERYFTDRPCRRNHTDYRYTSNGECVTCVRDKGMSRDKEVRRAQSKGWHNNNRESALSKMKERYLSMREHEKARAKRWREDNHEKYRETYLRYYALNREKIISWFHHRRAAGGSFTKDDIKAIMKAQRGRCAYCRIKITEQFHIDHIKPIVLGGTNEPKNLQLTCPTCNRRKNRKAPEDFARELGLLL